MNRTKIPWCDYSFNAWIGCTKVSPGCLRCYAESLCLRRGWAEWGDDKPRHRTTKQYWRQVETLAWRTREENLAGKPSDTLVPGLPIVFCGSMMDWLDPVADPKDLADLMSLLTRTRNLFWLLLSKRTHLWKQRMLEARAACDDPHGCRLIDDWLAGIPPTHVGVGSTMEDQPRANLRMSDLVMIPAFFRFISFEPLLGPIDLEDAGAAARRMRLGNPLWRINWAFCGSETGSGARPVDLDWIRSLRRQCREARIPFMLNQVGGTSVGDDRLDGETTRELPAYLARLAPRSRGELLKAGPRQPSVKGKP